MVHPFSLLCAEECDEAIEELEDTRRRVRALSRPPPGYVPLSARVKTVAVAVKNGTLITLRFLLSVPGRCGRAWELRLGWFAAKRMLNRARLHGAPAAAL